MELYTCIYLIASAWININWLAGGAALELYRSAASTILCSQPGKLEHAQYMQFLQPQEPRTIFIVGKDLPDDGEIKLQIHAWAKFSVIVEQEIKATKRSKKNNPVSPHVWECHQEPFSVEFSEKILVNIARPT